MSPLLLDLGVSVRSAVVALNRKTPNVGGLSSSFVSDLRGLAAALGLTTAFGRLEARPAGAALDGVRVEDGEAGLHDVIDVVDFRAAHERCTLLVDEDLHAGALEDDIALFAALGDRHAVLVAGA